MSQPTSFLKRGLKSALSIFVTQTKITKIDRLTENFILIEMAGTKLTEAKWVPGGKVQVDVGNLTFRTYTPIHLDTNEGKLSVLCYLREESPAAIWIHSLKVGDSCDVFGPRESLDLSHLEGDVALFGDETSLGITKVLQNQTDQKARVFLEVNSDHETKNALERLGVTNQTIIKRSTNNSHLEKMAEEMIELNRKNANLSTIFLTGRASSIQRIRLLLKESGIPNTKLKVRAYWADGKVGLD
ncbi:siderophore-interacting protein [Leptospira idonii]|uniref:Siderophore-interacting protein n=1 Tax=Leptospira idonii TaxID=1193500 RepID=A0A4R9LWT5_9LEPT|nr:SIP domain-containing protein [Leptospira idonii]TGN18039.1 siderophore-interacting protein [Leptospira idonii]